METWEEVVAMVVMVAMQQTSAKDRAMIQNVVLIML